MRNRNWNPMVQSFRRILHPTDFTPGDALPFQVACALARGLNAELIVMHSAPMKELREVRGYRAEIERRLNVLARSEPSLKITTNLLSGDPASRIVGWAYESLCDAIVMRQSRKNWLVGRFVDSVSQRVKRLAHCPVILIPGEAVPASVLKKGRGTARHVIFVRRSRLLRSQSPFFDSLPPP